MEKEHPCLCDICLRARDEELKRQRIEVIKEFDNALYGVAMPSETSNEIEKIVISLKKRGQND